MYLSYVERNRSPMFEELWSEIADAPGEIFDRPMTAEELAEFQRVCEMSEEEYYYYMEAA